MTQVHKKLEDYWWFPYMAWTVSIGLTILVIFLALELRETAANIEKSSLNLEQRMQAVEEMFVD